MRLAEKILTTLVGACIFLSLTGACHRKNAEAETIAAVKIENADSYILNEILKQQNREKSFVTGQAVRESKIFLILVATAFVMQFSQKKDLFVLVTL